MSRIARSPVIGARARLGIVDERREREEAGQGQGARHADPFLVRGGVGGEEQARIGDDEERDASGAGLGGPECDEARRLMAR